MATPTAARQPFNLQQGGQGMQLPERVGSSLQHYTDSLLLGGTRLDSRAEARRQRLWEGPLGASSWRGFFLGPAGRYDVPLAGHEYGINLRYWRRLGRIMRIALTDPLTALLAVACVLCNFAFVLLITKTVVALSGAVSSTTMTYMRLLSPRSPVRSAVIGSRLPSDVKNAVLAFQDEASRAAKANLWFPPGPYQGVGSCGIQPPPAWHKVFHLPVNLWDCRPPNGYFPELGVVGSFLFWAFVVCLLSASVQLCGGAIIVRARLAITKHLHSRLFDGQAFYSTVMLSPAVDNYDQRITDDLNTTLTDGFGRVFGSLTVTAQTSLLLAALLAFFNLRQALMSINVVGGNLPALFWTLAGGATLLALLGYAVPVNHVSRLLYTQKRCEGDLRWSHCHLMEHSETVAFYGGEAHEEAAADKAFGRVYSVQATSLFYNSLLLALSQFFSHLVSFASVLLLYLGRFKASTIFTVWLNFQFGFGACLQIPFLYMMLSVSGGPCHRVGVLLETLEQHQQAQGPPRRPPGRPQREPLLDPGVGGFQPMVAQETRSIEVRSLCVAPPAAPSLILFQGLTLSIRPGDSIAIVGPSGCGKSSLLRVLAGLWPPLAGAVQVPKVHGRGGLFFLPQRSYVRVGTLQEQVTYPHAASEDEAEKVREILGVAGLSHLQREGGLHSVVDWPKMLGAGELQALAFARLLYHRPMFALMDEATSALDLHSEARLMQLCADRGITAISVCHRPSAAGFHKQLLRYTGQGTGMDHDPSSWRVLDVPSEDRTNAAALVQTAPPTSTDLDSQLARRAPGDQTIPTEDSGGMGRLFFHRFRHLIRLSVPTWSCWAACCFFVAITSNCLGGLLLILGSRFSGLFVADVSSLDATGGKYPARTQWFLAYFAVLPMIDLLITFVGGYCYGMLFLHMRRCATDAGHYLYFSQGVAFAMNSRREECLPGSAKWQPDQRLQQDLQLLSQSMRTCIGDTLKAATILAIGLAFACYLTWLVSFFVLVLVISLILLEYVANIPVSNANIRLARAEGTFRVAHARVREFAESIVFNRGQAAESAVLDELLVSQVVKQGYRVLARAVGLILSANSASNLMAVIPPLLVSMVVFYWGPEDWGGSQITPETLGSTQTFFSAILAQTDKLVGAVGGISITAGLTHRIGAFLQAASVAVDFVQGERESQNTATVDQGKISIRNMTITSRGHSSIEASVQSVLIKDLSVEVPAGRNLLISGDTGSGKSSLMRALAGLQPASGGGMIRPPLISANGERKGESCMFVPQESYASGGSLRDEVVYPVAARADDARVLAALEAVGLGHLQQREGLDRAADWAAELSGGELQRLGLARALYHRPAFALLDDATSALDADTERRCLGALQEAGVTLITVSHREGLRAFHPQRLRLAGSKAGGGWTLEGEETQLQ